MYQLLRVGIVFMFMSIGAPSFATGNEGGSGGDGVRINQKLYLVDLLEAGVEDNPYVDESLEQDPSYLPLLARITVPLKLVASDAALRLVALKLLEIARVSTPLALTLLQTIESYSWVKVNHKLVDIKDEDGLLEIENGELVQLAIRRLHTIRFSRSSADELNPFHFAATVFHEAVYAIVIPTGDKVKFQSSAKARELVGVLFTEEKQHLSEIVTGIGIDFKAVPTRGDFYEHINPSLNRASGWIVNMKAKLQLDGNDVVEGTLRDPFSPNTTEELCKEVPSLYEKLSRKREIALYMKQTRTAYEPAWNSFEAKDGQTLTFLHWSVPRDVFPNDAISYFRYLRPANYIGSDSDGFYFSHERCVHAINKRLKAYKDYFSRQSIIK